VIARPAPASPPARLLLDTRVWLWWQADDRRLAKAARSAIAHAADVYVSAVSAWEMAIKSALGKLTAPEDVAEAVEAGVQVHPISRTS